MHFVYCVNTRKFTPVNTHKIQVRDHENPHLDHIGPRWTDEPNTFNPALNQPSSINDRATERNKCQSTANQLTNGNASTANTSPAKVYQSGRTTQNKLK